MAVRHTLVIYYPLFALKTSTRLQTKLTKTKSESVGEGDTLSLFLLSIFYIYLSSSVRRYAPAWIRRSSADISMCCGHIASQE